MAHKALVGGTAYNVSGGKTLVGGTIYNINGGKTLINGTAYNIAVGDFDFDKMWQDAVVVSRSGVNTALSFQQKSPSIEITNLPTEKACYIFAAYDAYFGIFKYSGGAVTKLYQFNSDSIDLFVTSDAVSLSADGASALKVFGGSLIALRFPGYKEADIDDAFSGIDHPTGTTKSVGLNSSSKDTVALKTTSLNSATDPTHLFVFYNGYIGVYKATVTEVVVGKVTQKRLSFEPLFYSNSAGLALYSDSNYIYLSTTDSAATQVNGGSMFYRTVPVEE